jgi:hypothetical protein
MTDDIVAGVLAERRREYWGTLERFDDAVTRVERIIAMTDRALDHGDNETAGQLVDLLRQAQELAGARNDEAAIARAAVIDARLAVARGQARGPDR